MTGSADWVEKASQLLQSRRIAANVVLGVFIALAIGLYLRGEVSAFAGFSPSVQMLLLGILLVACYSVAVLITGFTIDAFRSVRDQGIRTRAEASKKLADEAARAEKEGQLRTVLLELTTLHFDLLGEFKAKNPADRPSAVFGPRAQSFVESDLLRLGFIVEIAKVGLNRTLFELTPAAEQIVPAFVADYRRRMITGALERAGESEKTLLYLFAVPGPRTPEEPLHSFLTRDVYMTIPVLEHCQVLKHERAKYQGILPKSSYRETISLTPDAIPFVEEMLGEKVVRTEVVLDLSKVQGTGASGGGGTH